MTHFRTTPTTLRVLLMSALGASSLAGCAGRTDECSDSDGPCTPGSGGSDGDGVGGTQTGGTGGTTGTGGTASTGGTGNAPGSVSGCTDQTPLLEGADTGIFRCSEGYLHRQQAKLCPSPLPRDNDVAWPDPGLGGAANYTTSTDDCSTDSECDEHSYCYLSQTNAFSYGECYVGPAPEDEIPDYARLCSLPGCVADADCADNQVCVCGPLVGECHTISAIAGCKEDADCEAGFLCLQNSSDGYLSSGAFACQLPGDECDSAADCTAYSEYCGLVADPPGRVCQQAPICGRPFLVEAEARIAAEVETPAWLRSSSSLDVHAVALPEDDALRHALAEHWTRVGLLEHASVAAFARFTLQLLSLGAPLELIEAANDAQRDETRHAQLAFQLASHYRGYNVGPGPLGLEGAFTDSSVEVILRTTIQEGCMGETRAALEASRAAELCEDASVRAVLEGIAADESRHAELAWKVVRWLVTNQPELSRIVAEEFLQAERAERGRQTPSEAGFPLQPRTPSPSARHGLLAAAELSLCHRQAQREVIGPCGRTLLTLTATALRA